MKKKEFFKEGLKFDTQKLRFDLISTTALYELARIYSYGAIKYEDRNMEKGMRWSRVFGALQRHSWAFWHGEDLDDESKLYHMAHAMWCCATLLDYLENHREYDDRPYKPRSAGHYSTLPVNPGKMKRQYKEKKK